MRHHWEKKQEYIFRNQWRHHLLCELNMWICMTQCIYTTSDTLFTSFLVSKFISCPALLGQTPDSFWPILQVYTHTAITAGTVHFNEYMLQQPIMFIVDSRVGPAGTTFIITGFCIIIYLDCCYFSGCRHQTSVGKNRTIDIYKSISCATFYLNRVGDAIYDRYDLMPYIWGK
jgi:hypothetical protein